MVLPPSIIGISLRAFMIVLPGRPHCRLDAGSAPTSPGLTITWSRALVTEIKN